MLETLALHLWYMLQVFSSYCQLSFDLFIWCVTIRNYWNNFMCPYLSFISSHLFLSHFLKTLPYIQVINKQIHSCFLFSFSLSLLFSKLYFPRNIFICRKIWEYSYFSHFLLFWWPFPHCHFYFVNLWTFFVSS